MHVSRESWFQRTASLTFVVALVMSFTPALHAQLGWEGETGVFVTPFAYTASAPGQKLHPVVAYHYFNGGPIMANFKRYPRRLASASALSLGIPMNFIRSATTQP